MRELKLVYPSSNEGFSEGLRQVAFTASLAGSVLRAHFSVEQGDEAPFANAALGGGDGWGLWDWDVVELFVSDSSTRLPYCEFVLSPLGQVFQLRIHEPRKKFDREFRCPGLVSRARIQPGKGWEATLELPLQELFPGWKGNPLSLVGNAFAILGKEPKRAYFSLFTPPQARPDFHLPAHFRPILS